MLYNDTITEKGNHLKFLAEKICEIRKAIFRADVDTMQTLPNNLINTLDVDEEGHVWFLTSSNDNYTRFSEKEFYAYLEYYQKGRDTRLLVSGVATIQEDALIPEKFSAQRAYTNGTTFMIKLKIMKAEYSYVPKKAGNWKEWISHLWKRCWPIETSGQYDLF
ncbi:hypothetical protein QTN47_15750 [Danxiaibacter flavus]|uniref:General stress protein FMN-binding split barrel domain-containing protein n=1 Tax=Danxiaibacter flavus TaxID=3049108 RepID=A0ABV3ZGM3_9BACT|nr:hypothetical protein QNM32_15760 [Chitinophagaceae bacterium DXS]